MRLEPLLLLALCISTAGCGSISMTRSGPQVPSRGEHCDFQVLTAMPAGSFVELGTVDVEPGGYGAHVYKTLDDFKQNIEPYVCEAGGDVAVAMANGLGWYLKATILKAKPAAAEAQSSTPVAAADGCRFDTQCKGDRICVKGECVDPAKK
jgi:hypothetical protein